MLKNKNQNNGESNEQEKNITMTSACESYRKMLQGIPKVQTHEFGGKSSFGASTSGNMIFTMPPAKEEIVSYDKDTNSLVRAKFACEEGLVVSPFSTKETTIFTTPEKFPDHLAFLKESEHKEAENQDRRCVIQ